MLLVCDQGGEYADDGHGDRQKDQQEFVRTWPNKMHLTPPGSPPQKLTRYTRKCNQRYARNATSPAWKVSSRTPLLEETQRSYGGMRRPLSIACPTRPYVSG